METTHRVLAADIRGVSVPPASVHLVVTSPPYPMIAMWDACFAAMDPSIREALSRNDGAGAFESMHRILDDAWATCVRALVPGGFLCVNIGDATRTLGGEFGLYPNHARILGAFQRLGLTILPDILWRKPTNAPNKFMGSGMLPAGAYVTYEHEYVLIARKGGKREFDAPGKQRRLESAYFWEERNQWFSDLWSEIPGTRQKQEGDRARSAAFPIEIPYRLVQMYSLLGDTVLDPFAGTGTTLQAALGSGRNSVGAELDPALAAGIRQALAPGSERAQSRLEAHRRFVADRVAAGKDLKHRSAVYGFPVVTSQEVALELWAPATAEHRGECVVGRCELVGATG